MPSILPLPMSDLAPAATPPAGSGPEAFDHIESVYWVFTQRCNDTCAHCYNYSGPDGETISLDDCLAIVANLPARVDRVILSGGEPLTERAKLYAILDALVAKYGTTAQIMIQTNGDLLTPERLTELLRRGVTRVDIASIDRFHQGKGERQAELTALFEAAGMIGDDPDPLVDRERYLHAAPSYGFWGATDDMWLGGNWARGRAWTHGIALDDGSHNFCAILSGARGYLGGTELPQEVSIQLWRLNPCCPGTRSPIADARRVRIADALAAAADDPILRALNTGDIYAVGESLGISADYGHARADALGSVCRWCDEFFTRHYDLTTREPRDAPDESVPEYLLPVLYNLKQAGEVG